MRKSTLVNLVNTVKDSKVLSIFLLSKFLETKSIRELDKNSDVSFSNYLTFLQKDLYKAFPNILDLFKEPHLNLESNEAQVLAKFLEAEDLKRPLITNHNLLYEFNKINFASGPASAIAILPDGRMITSTCYFDSNGYPKMVWDPITTTMIHASSIVLRDSTGKIIETLVHEPASAIALLPDGNMITSTCFFDKYGWPKMKWDDATQTHIHASSIVLRDKTGKKIKTLVHEPAAAIVILRDGRMITSTCYFDNNGWPKMEWDNQEEVHLSKIILREATGETIKILAHEPASSITILPDDTMITTTCYFDGYGWPKTRWDEATQTFVSVSKIVLRNLDGERIKILASEPAASLVMLPTGNFMASTCYFDEYGWPKKAFDPEAETEIHLSKISFIKPTLTTELIEEPRELNYFYAKINKLLEEKSEFACLLFHKGVVEKAITPTKNISILCTLPSDILNTIYSYIFTGKIQRYEILNPNTTFPNPNIKDYKEVPLVKIIDDKARKFLFYKQAKIKNDIKEIIFEDILKNRVFKTSDHSKDHDNKTKPQGHSKKQCNIM